MLYGVRNMVPMRDGNRRQVGNRSLLYYYMSLFFTEQFHPLSLPCASYTSHLPPPAAGRQSPPEARARDTLDRASCSADPLLAQAVGQK